MMKDYHRTLLYIFILFASQTALSQGYRIEATIRGLSDSSLVLGHYSRNNTTFILKDTAKADATGKVVFEGKSNLPGGLYVILFPGNRSWVELVYSGKESSFAIEKDTVDAIGNMKVTGSAENELFTLTRKN